MSDDTRTKNAKQLLAMMKATMNLDLDELINAGVIEDRSGQECSPWTKWNKDAPTFIAKLDDRSLNSLAALIKHKFPDAFPPSADDLLRQAIEALTNSCNLLENYIDTFGDMSGANRADVNDYRAVLSLADERGL